METAMLEDSLRRFDCTRWRFESRQRFFDRCIADIESDFHKQYGPFYRDWELTHEACVQYHHATKDYLRTRDVLAMEFRLLLGTLSVAETAYAKKKASKRFGELMSICEDNDRQTLAEIDEDIRTIRTVYQMIRSAECEREE